MHWPVKLNIDYRHLNVALKMTDRTVIIREFGINDDYELKVGDFCARAKLIKGIYSKCKCR